jgi:hypothetical protein
MPHKGDTHAPLEIRLWRRVDKSSDCWLWTGYVNRKGYGEISFGGAGRGTTFTHRASWELHHGPIPAGSFVLHRCDTPACVRPEHLFLGSLHVNALDCHAKGRNYVKANPGMVRYIRARAARGARHREIAEEVGLHRSTVRQIVERRTWRHVP